MAIFRNAALAVVVGAYAYIFIPALWLFVRGIDSGMIHVDRVYPYPQPRQPLRDHPVLIYTHMYANTLALGLQLILLFCHPPHVGKTLHSRLAIVHGLLLVPGTLASVVYAFAQDYGRVDGGKSGAFAFAVMGTVTLMTLATTCFYRFVRVDTMLHREWALRHAAVLIGNGVGFRVLANTYLVAMDHWGAHGHAAWCQMVYLSWIVPLLGIEQYISLERVKGDTVNTMAVLEKRPPQS